MTAFEPRINESQSIALFKGSTFLLWTRVVRRLWFMPTTTILYSNFFFHFLAWHVPSKHLQNVMNIATTKVKFESQLDGGSKIQS